MTILRSNWLFVFTACFVFTGFVLSTDQTGFQQDVVTFTHREISLEDAMLLIDRGHLNHIETSPTHASLIEKRVSTVIWHQSQESPVSFDSLKLNASLHTESFSQLIESSSGTSTEKWYWEITTSQIGNHPSTGMGICTSSAEGGYQANLIYHFNGDLIEKGQVIQSIALSEGDTIGFALDAINDRAWIQINHEWIGGDPEQGLGGLKLGQIKGVWHPCIVMNQGDQLSANFGQRSWNYQSPIGYQVPWVNA